MSSLQDQLIKAGLSNKHKARQANSDKRKKNKQKRSGQSVEQSLQEKVQIELKQKQQQDKEKQQALAKAEATKREQKELYHRIKQILMHRQVPVQDGEIAYNYTDGNTVKKFWVDEKTQQALVNGVLALCVLDEQTFVVTAETAEKLNTLDDSVVKVKNEKSEDVIDEDDPYAEYQIPDDLMW